MVIQPTLIAPEHNIKIKVKSVFEFPHENELAFVEHSEIKKRINFRKKMSTSKNPFVDYSEKEEKPEWKHDIVINEWRARELWKKSWLYKKITLEEVLIGLQLHEVAHVKYGSFLIHENETKAEKTQAENEILNHIINILEDARIEYKMSNEFPAYAKYFTWLLSMIKETLEVNSSKGNNIEKYIKTIFDIARFGIIPLIVEDEFINLAVPIILSAKRMDEFNCRDAGRVLMDYIMIVNEDTRKEVESASVSSKTEAIDEQEIKRVEGEEGIGKMDFNKVDESISATRTEEASTMGTGGNTTMVVNDVSNAFYRATVEKYWEQIIAIRNIFKRLYNAHKQTKTFDGDLNMMRQQEAYMNSIVGDESKDYLQSRLVAQKVDVCVLRDVSVSTDNMKEKYAEALIVIMAALEDIKGICTTQIDFSDTHRVNKQFEDKLKDSTITPETIGGTKLYAALSAASKMKFEAKKRICILITDGYLADERECKPLLSYMAKTQGFDFLKLIVGAKNDGYISVEVEQLPEVVSEFVLKKVRK